MSGPFPPRTTFGTDFLRKVASGLVAACRLDPPVPHRRSKTAFEGWLLHIDLDSRRVVYRLGAHLKGDAGGYVYEAAWPD